MAKWFKPKTQTHTPPRPPIDFPTNADFSIVNFLFQNSPSSSFPHSHSIALINADTGDTLTFHQLKIHALLQVFNVIKNDFVLTFAPNSIHFPVCFLAIVSIGDIVTTCNPSYTTKYLLKQVKDCNPKLIFTVPELYKRVRESNFPCVIISSDPISCSDHNFVDLQRVNQQIERGFKFTDEQSNSERCSGASVLVGNDGDERGSDPDAKEFHRGVVYGDAGPESRAVPRNVFLCFLPMFHLLGLSVILYSQLLKGNSSFHGEICVPEGIRGGEEIQSNASVGCSACNDKSGEANCCIEEIRSDVIEEADSIRRSSFRKRCNGRTRHEYSSREDRSDKLMQKVVSCICCSFTLQLNYRRRSSEIHCRSGFSI